MLREQVNELRKYSELCLQYCNEQRAKELLKEAADTIESLSAKLQEANTKYSTMYNKSCGSDCMYWDSMHGGCSIHNTIPNGCKDFYSMCANVDEN